MPDRAALVKVLNPETSESDIIRTEISDTMVLAGIRALGQWHERLDAGETVTKRDAVCSIYAAMRLPR